MLKTSIAPASFTDGILGASSLDSGARPMPTEGMRAITAICAQSQVAMGEMMRSKPAGLGIVVAGNNASGPAVTHSISGMNGAALAGLAGVGAALSASGSSAKKGKEKSGRTGTSGSSTASAAKPAPTTTPTTTPTTAKPAEKTPTPPPGGTAKVPEPPTKAPIDPNIYSGFEEPELGKGTKITLGGDYGPKPYEISPIYITADPKK